MLVKSNEHTDSVSVWFLPHTVHQVHILKLWCYLIWTPVTPKYKKRWKTIKITHLTTTTTYIIMLFYKVYVVIQVLFLCAGRSSVFLRSEQGVELMCWKSRDKTATDFKNISKLLSWRVIICCIHRQASKSQLTKLAPALFFCSSVFLSGIF